MQGSSLEILTAGAFSFAGCPLLSRKGVLLPGALLIRGRRRRGTGLLDGALTRAR